MGPAAALLTVLSCLILYYALSERLPNLGLWWDVALICIPILPAALLTIWLLLPLRRRLGGTGLLQAALGLAALTAVFELTATGVGANFAKLLAVALAGWWVLRFFEEVSWVVLVALVIVPVDAYSVARGPTKAIVEGKPEIFDLLSFAMRVPGQESTAQLGLPDILFFALFLGAAERFGLRIGWTWLAMVLSFNATLVIAIAAGIDGLPALPLLSVAFVATNADRLRQQWRERRLGT